MEEQLNPLAVAHLLQHTLRGLCIHENSMWVYAVFWRILPRNHPAPKWDLEGGAYKTTRRKRSKWILAWEDGFCNFASSIFKQATIDSWSSTAGGSSGYGDCQGMKGLQPELFFKMSHEIHNYGEGLVGKVAADQGYKWVFKEPQVHDQINNVLPRFSNPADYQPRSWEAQFQSGIKAIALVAVREGVVQLGAVNKVMEDLSYVGRLREKFDCLGSIPGFLLPHPAMRAFPTGNHVCSSWHENRPVYESIHHHFDHHQLEITPSSGRSEQSVKLPSFAAPLPGYDAAPALARAPRSTTGVMEVDKGLKSEMEEEHDEDGVWW